MKISVYIPAYNSEKTIKYCLDGLFNQTLKPNEIILINDGSTDKTIDIASKYKIKIINHKTNKGIAQVRNTALKIAKNDFLAGIDSDTIADKDWLKELYKTIKKEKAVIVGGKIEENIITTADKWRQKHLKQDWGEKKEVNPNFIAGNNFLCSKKELKMIGNYNKKFTTNYEDVDISKRLKEKGFKLIYESNAKVFHLTKDNNKSVLDRHWKHVFWDYPTPDSFNKKLFRIIINLYITIKYLFSDITEKQEFILIDLKLFFHHTKKDFKY